MADPIIPDTDEPDDGNTASWTVNGITYTVQTDEVYDPTTDVKIYRYCPAQEYSKKTPPFDLNYITGLNRRLYYKQYFIQGELYLQEYYANTATGSDSWPTYSDLILTENMVYTRDDLGFAKERTTTIAWILENNTPHPQNKVLHKTYSILESQLEGITRRSNIINQLSITVAGILIQVLPTNSTYPDDQSKIEVGRQFLQTHKLSCDMFVQASERIIVSDVKYATDFWLNIPIDANGTTIRTVLLSEIDIWGIQNDV